MGVLYIVLVITTAWAMWLVMLGCYYNLYYVPYRGQGSSSKTGVVALAIIWACRARALVVI